MNLDDLLKSDPEIFFIYFDLSDPESDSEEFTKDDSTEDDPTGDDSKTLTEENDGKYGPYDTNNLYDDMSPIYMKS